MRWKYLTTLSLTFLKKRVVAASLCILYTRPKSIALTFDKSGNK